MDDFQVKLSRSAQENLEGLMRDSSKRTVVEKVYTLLKQLGLRGAVQGNMPNYSKLADGRHHCHLKKGRPTYVAIWTVEGRVIKVTYIGTHEKAPY